MTGLNDIPTHPHTHPQTTIPPGCMYGHKGWWTYELCFRTTAVQYHVDSHIVKDTVRGGGVHAALITLSG